VIHALENGIEKHAPCCIAADLGAGSGRVVAGQLVNGSLRLQEISRFATAFGKDAQTGYLCWPVDRIEDEIRRAIGAASAEYSVRSVGVDSWGVDYVLLDARLQRVGIAVAYRDDRTAGMIERVTSRLSAAEIYRITGAQFQPYNTLYQLAAMAEGEPEWTARARHLLMIPDYFHWRLSGVLSNEYTEATTTQMLDLDGRWNEEIFKAAGLPGIWMQPPVAAGTELGQMQAGNASIKVITPATHDTASAVAGTPLETPDEAYLSSGTWSLLGIESAVPLASEQALRWNFTNEGGYARRYRVLKNIMGLWLLQKITEEFGIVTDDELLQAAANVKPWRSLVNPDDARFMNPPSMREAIRGYCRETGQPEPDSPAEFARCVLESLALCYSAVIEQIEALAGRRISRIRVVGGGSRNRLLNQMCADSCQLPISAGPVEASALGNVCAQMIALGEIRDLDEARKLIRQSFVPEEFLPRAEVPVEVTNRFRQYSSGAQKIAQ